MITIKFAENGFIVEHSNPHDAEDRPTLQVYKEDEIREILHCLIDTLTHGGGSRYDAERYYVIKAPGDKHPDFTDELSDLIFGE